MCVNFELYLQHLMHSSEKLRHSSCVWSQCRRNFMFPGRKCFFFRFLTRVMVTINCLSRNGADLMQSKAYREEATHENSSLYLWLNSGKFEVRTCSKNHARFANKAPRNGYELLQSWATFLKSKLCKNKQNLNVYIELFQKWFEP